MLLFPDAFWRRAIFMAALAVGSSGSMAIAQESDMSAPVPGSDQIASPPEVVTITPPNHRPTRSTIGAPIEDVSLSASVRTDDLNPLSTSDWIELRHRVRETAQQLCRRLGFQHPIGTPDESGCVRRAIETTSDEIDSAILNGRGARIENP